MKPAQKNLNEKHIRFLANVYRKEFNILLKHFPLKNPIEINISPNVTFFLQKLNFGATAGKIALSFKNDLMTADCAINVNEKNEKYNRFTLAHEFAHYILNKEYPENVSNLRSCKITFDT